MVYLLVGGAGFILALLALVWLFGETPGEGKRTGYETIERSRYTDRFEAANIPPASSSERSEDEAA